MPSTARFNSEEASHAAWEGGRGAVAGAAKWGFFAAILGGAGYRMSPIYRGLTIQFKVFLQMSGMILGACLEADSRVREYEAKIRMERRMLRDRAVWESYEKEFEDEDLTEKSR
ncbi:uncharacterized protein RAG0_03850 [Rhynchosporium agropyri]|uniref:Imidazoleglycerol-phosphate dehydratase n=1 Tax=Rhynchosporium agropyri TaxID=914238 RepID=A0A1E1K6G1_9HELO|nr:uncharacterized protein RAG0_03850 [Rhynchosporium agropyri]